ncbi:amidase [Glonium stellatum]|uniref:Amidase n=1 Tax=Glonium stellatum TaxID=574774 RepID=A0A8E2EYM3_9PEZI|nr:amidase [Glonium stellatum]
MRLDIREATIDSVHNSLYSGLTSCREVVSSFLSRVEAFDTRINAIISLNPAALALAERIDAALAVGNATGPLFCIPVLLKDNYDTSNMNTTGGNLGLAGSQPSVDAPSVVALERAGAVILGKVNLHELALEGLSVSSLGGQTINPYDFSRTPGGSSGGSGAAVAASFSVLATGSDTVNSLRSPASANSLFSIRPTRGLISRAGIIPISYTQDVIGPIARTVKDVATALTVMASIGFDSADNATALVPETSRGMDYTIFLTAGNLKGIRLGVINGFFNRTDSNETAPVNEAMDTMIHKLQSAGVIIIPINEGIYNVTAIRSLDVQRFEYRESMDTYLTQPSLNGVHPHNLLELYAMDSSSGSGKFLVIPSQYEFVNTVLISSTSNATYASIQSNIHSLTVALHSTLSQNNLDAIIYPEQQNLVVKLGSPSQSDRNGILAALTGSPVVTVPAGFSAASEEAPVGVPIGMEILGRPWQEESLLRIAYQIEMLTHVRRMPAWAKETVEAKSYVGVPVVKPNNRNIPTEYPVGVL